MVDFTSPTPHQKMIFSLFKKTPVAGSYDPMLTSLYMEADKNETIPYKRAEVVSDAYGIKSEFNSAYGSPEQWDFGIDVGELYDWIICRVHHKKYGIN